MNKTPKLILLSALLGSLVAVYPASLLANGATPSASQGGVYWQVTVPNDGVSLRVSMPDGAVFEQKYASGQSPVFTSQRGVLPDGVYAWELVMSPVVSPEMRAKAENARANGQPASLPSGSVESGTFRVARGAVMLPDGSILESQKAGSQSGVSSARGSSAPITPNDQVIPDDLIVQGSECVGLDCVNNESFGFDTIRLKENNTRIKFDDTSTGAGFPATDWQLTANDSANGGANKFSIEDITDAKVPFTITGNAPTNSIFVDNTGRVGLRTATPVLDLHIATGNTPAMRLEQNASSGFTAQTWDVAGNEANFFIRDVTGGSRLPFRIQPGAPSNSIFVSAGGNVGFGTTSVSDADGLAERFIEIKDSSGDARVVVDSNDGAGRFGEFLFQRSNVNKWSFGNDNNQFYIFNYTAGAGSGNAMAIANATGNIVIPHNLTVNGTFSNPSSREIKNLLASVDGASVLAKLSSLPLFTWSYKNDESVRHFGPVAEDFYERFSLGLDEKHISPNDMAGVALAATQALNKVVSEKDAEIRELKERLQRLESRLGFPPDSTAKPKTSD